MQAAILLRPVPSQDEIEATRTKALAAIETARLTIKKGGHEQILQDLQLVINHTEFLACMMQDRDYASQEKRRFR